MSRLSDYELSHLILRFEQEKTMQPMHCVQNLGALRDLVSARIEIARLEREIAALRAARQWRTGDPPESGRYLVTLRMNKFRPNFVMDSFWNGKLWEFNSDEIIVRDQKAILRWQTMPEAWKEEG